MSADRLVIQVWADWVAVAGPKLMGTLYALPSRGKEIFSFEYDVDWLKSPFAQGLDPSIHLFGGPQYAPAGQENFGLFLASCPDRWGRLLMRRREAQQAREENRRERTLLESDYLLGVHDKHRMGGLRFRMTADGPFLDDSRHLASPPWTSLAELEQVSLNLERDDAAEDPDYAKWLKMLIAPGGSLGGARPKASVLDERGALWIAKFPSGKDGDDVGAWEQVAHLLAKRAGLVIADTQLRQFGSPHHTFLSKRFDRTGEGGRLHFASAMTLLQHSDGRSSAEPRLSSRSPGMVLGAGLRHQPHPAWRRASAQHLRKRQRPRVGTRARSGRLFSPGRKARFGDHQPDSRSGAGMAESGVELRNTQGRPGADGIGLRCCEIVREKYNILEAGAICVLGSECCYGSSERGDC